MRSRSALDVRADGLSNTSDRPRREARKAATARRTNGIRFIEEGETTSFSVGEDFDAMGF